STWPHITTFSPCPGRALRVYQPISCLGTIGARCLSRPTGTSLRSSWIVSITTRTGWLGAATAPTGVGAEVGARWASLSNWVSSVAATVAVAGALVGDGGGTVALIVALAVALGHGEGEGGGRVAVGGVVGTGEAVAVGGSGLTVATAVSTWAAAGGEGCGAPQ